MKCERSIARVIIESTKLLGSLVSLKVSKDLLGFLGFLRVPLGSLRFLGVSEGNLVFLRDKVRLEIFRVS